MHSYSPILKEQTSSPWPCYLGIGNVLKLFSDNYKQAVLSDNISEVLSPSAS